MTTETVFSDGQNSEDMFEEWFSHPITQVLVRRLREKNIKLLDELFARCQITGDPSIREAYTVYHANQQAIDLLSKKRR